MGLRHVAAATSHNEKNSYAKAKPLFYQTLQVI